MALPVYNPISTLLAGNVVCGQEHHAQKFSRTVSTDNVRGMSLSRCKTVLKRAYGSLLHSQQSHHRKICDESSYLPQVTRKVKALEEQCGGAIEIESPSFCGQHRSLPNQEQETSTTTDPIDADDAAVAPIYPPRCNSTNSRSEAAVIDGKATAGGRIALDDINANGSAEQAAIEGGGYRLRSPSQDTLSIASSKMTSKEVAQHLISKEEMSDYFSSLVEGPAAAAVEENVSEGKCDFTTTCEVTMAQERGEDRFTKLCDLPLKLILTPIRVRGRVVSKFASLLEMQFGPLHAALQVGDVILEWNDTSLVVPHYAEHDDQLMKTDVRHLTDWVTFTGGEVPRVREAIRKLDYQTQIELVYHVTSEKQRLIDNLVDVIITYNRQYYYDIIRKNCQHFVADALKALGVNQPIEFTGGLGEYFKALKSGRSLVLHTRFTDHCHLDSYVREKRENGEMGDLTKNDLEYLLAQYFRYHLEQKTRMQRDSKEAELSGWSCAVKGCCMAMLEESIDFKSLRIHNFKTYDRPQ